MKTQKTISRILDGLILLVFILFFSSAGFQDRNTSGWYQQWFPNLNGSSISSITFLDSLTGFAVTNTNSSLEAYILKTTNGGDNWNINYTYTQTNSNWTFVKIGFADSNTGYAFGWSEMFKTTNAGLNWDIIITSLYAEDISIINKDTMLAVSSSGLDGGVFRSTNSGTSWQLIWGGGGNGMPSRIYMYDKSLGFTMSSSYMRRTTNGGFNWTIIPGESFSGIHFLDSLTGWKTYAGIQKTTNGGINWLSQQLPNISSSFFTSDLFALNKDTVWMVGARKYKSAPVYKTTNGGLNWGYQIPDTSLLIYDYYYVKFVNGLIGWLFRPTPLLLRTNTGGNDTTYFTGINNILTVSPMDYRLFQNYPNPFNTGTVIRYKLSVAGNVSIKVYDVQGHEVQTLVEKRLNPGEYSVSFNGNNLSSGIYFYKLYANEKIIETRKMTLLK